MIITDGVHLVSTEDEEELHAFAGKLGFLKSWYQTKNPRHPHYDLTTINALNRALRLGAVKVSPCELLTTAWWSRWPGAWQPKKPCDQMAAHDGGATP